MWTSVIAGFTAVVAVVAAGVSVKQARLAVRSTEASESQATTASDAFDLAKAQKYEADRPDYGLEIRRSTDGFASDLVVRLKSGPPNVELAARWESGWALRTETGEIERGQRYGGQTAQPRDLIRNQAAGLGVSIPSGVFYIRVKLWLTSREIGGAERKWEEPRFVEWGDPNGGDYPGADPAP